MALHGEFGKICKDLEVSNLLWKLVHSSESFQQFFFNLVKMHPEEYIPRDFHWEMQSLLKSRYPVNCEISRGEVRHSGEKNISYKMWQFRWCNRFIDSSHFKFVSPRPVLQFCEFRFDSM